MTIPLPSARPIAPRPWWRRALAALGRAVLVQVLAGLALHGVLPAPWNAGLPMALGGAVFFTYHPEWLRPRWRRATLAQAAALVALGLAVVGGLDRAGWWR